MPALEPLSIREASRLALVRAGLLAPGLVGLPDRAAGGGKRARAAALAHLRHFGYLQLDTVAVAGARSHAIVLLSRLTGLAPELPEGLLQPGEPVFEYWGHEASWLPLELYPCLAFRREEFRVHPWWGDLVGEHPRLADELLRRISDEGPLRSADLEGPGSRGWWDLKLTKKVATALWSSGVLAIRERRNFLRTYDLAERVVPAAVRERRLPAREQLKTLVLKALDGHGWATTATINATWRLVRRGAELTAALAELVEEGRVAPCSLLDADGKRTPGWIQPGDRELAAVAAKLRPRRDRGVLLSPFDPLLWDRGRVARLFGFAALLEIFKRQEQRVYGYYCLPVLAGDRLVGRCDLKAERADGALRVLALHFEAARPAAAERAAARSALDRYAAALGLRLDGAP